MLSTVHRLAELEKMLQHLQDRAAELVGAVEEDEEAVADSVAKTTEIYKALSTKSKVLPMQDPEKQGAHKAEVEKNVEARLEVDMADLRSRMSVREEQWQMRPLMKYHVFTGFGAVLVTQAIDIPAFPQESCILSVGASGWLGLWRATSRHGKGPQSTPSTVSLQDFIAIETPYTLTCAVSVTVPSMEHARFLCGTEEGYALLVSATYEENHLSVRLGSCQRVSDVRVTYALKGPNDFAIAITVDANGDVNVLNTEVHTLSACSLSPIVPVASRKLQSSTGTMDITVISETNHTVQREHVAVPLTSAVQSPSDQHKSSRHLPGVTITALSSTENSRCLFLGSDVGDVYKVELLLPQPRPDQGPSEVVQAVHVHASLFTRLVGGGGKATLPPMSNEDRGEYQQAIVRAITTHGKWVLIGDSSGTGHLAQVQDGVVVQRAVFPPDIHDLLLCGGTHESLTAVSTHKDGSVNVVSYPLPQRSRPSQEHHTQVDRDIETEEHGASVQGSTPEIIGVHLFKSGLTSSPTHFQWDPKTQRLVVCASNEFVSWDLSLVVKSLSRAKAVELKRSDTLSALAPDVDMARAAFRARSGTQSIRQAARGDLASGPANLRASLPSGFNPLQKPGHHLSKLGRTESSPLVTSTVSDGMASPLSTPARSQGHGPT